MLMALRVLARDWRGGELGVLAAALVVAVTIVTGISVFAERLHLGLLQESERFIGGERVLRSPRPVPQEWLDRAVDSGAETGRTMEFSSMAFFNDAMQVSSVKAVSDTYPLVGNVKVKAGANAEVVVQESGPSAGRVWVDPRILSGLEAKVGDTLEIGDASLLIENIIVEEPDRGSAVFAYGPRVMMSIADIPATNIVQPGSRVRYRYQFDGDAELLAPYFTWLEEQLEPSHRLIGLDDSQPRLSESLARAKRFLLLAGSLGVLLAGLAIALAARRYSQRHFDYVAVMKTLGASSPWILQLYGLSLLSLAMIGIVIGCAAGWVVQTFFFEVIGDLLDFEVPPSGFKPYLAGAVTGLISLFAFAWPPLMGLRLVSPMRVMRRDFDEHQGRDLVLMASGVLGTLLLLYWYAEDWVLSLSVLGGVAVVAVLVAIASLILMRLSRAMGIQAGSAWRLALSAIQRRRSHNALQVLVFAITLMLSMILIALRTELIEDWRLQMPEDTPNHFMINIAPYEVDSLESQWDEAGISHNELYPLVRGRVVEINGRPVREVLAEKEEGDIEREMNLTWSDSPQPGNRVVEGEFRAAGDEVHYVSLEAGIADFYGVGPGDVLGFEIGSLRTEATVSSLREVDWEQMTPNFFMVFTPGALDGMPATYMTSLLVEAERKPAFNRIMREFPTVTVIEIEAIIEQIQSTIDRVSQAIELVLVLVLLSAALVLVASLRAGIDDRLRENAILRVIGAQRRLLLGSLTLEYVLLGIMAGVVAAIGAELSLFAIQKWAIQMAVQWHPWIWFAGPLAGAVLIAAIGLMASVKVVDHPPVTVLRELN